MWQFCVAIPMRFLAYLSTLFSALFSHYLFDWLRSFCNGFTTSLETSYHLLVSVFIIFMNRNIAWVWNWDIGQILRSFIMRGRGSIVYHCCLVCHPTHGRGCTSCRRRVVNFPYGGPGAVGRWRREVLRGEATWPHYLGGGSEGSRTCVFLLEGSAGGEVSRRDLQGSGSPLSPSYRGGIEAALGSP
jgi:hypothetical protein